MKKLFFTLVAVIGLGMAFGVSAFVLQTNESLDANTDKNTQNVVGLIRLQYLTDEAKALIAYVDKNGIEKVWLAAHDYLTYPDNRHKHFSIETSDLENKKQTRLGIEYDCGYDCDIHFNQSNVRISRNQGQRNGNLLMEGGVFKHSGTFSFYPSALTNGSKALQIGLSGEPFIRTAGGSVVRIDDSVEVTGNIVSKQNCVELAANGTTYTLSIDVNDQLVINKNTTCL